MAKLQYYVAGPNEYTLASITFLNVDVHSSTSLTLLSGSSADIKLILKGKGLTYDADDHVIAGTVTSIVYGDKDGAVWAKMTDVSLKPSHFAENPNYTMSGITSVALRGDDKITGSNDIELIHGYAGNDVIDGKGGDDWIYGESGKDRLTGGKGSDTFYFNGYGDKDIITDFDAKGGGTAQDYINAGGMGYALKQKGHDVIVTFDGGTQVTLLNVKESQIDDSDFIWP